LVINTNGADVDFRVESESNENMIFVDAGNNKVGIGGLPDNIDGSILTVSGDMSVDEYIYHNGDGDTFMKFVDDTIILKAGGKSFIKLEEKSSAPHEVIINDGSNNIDLVVKGNGAGGGNPAFKVDASTNRVGINGVGSPDEALHVGGNLKVAGGDITGSSKLKLAGSYQSQIAHSGTAGATISVDFDAAPLQTINLNTNVTHFHTVNRGHGKSVALRAMAGGSNRTLAFEPRLNFIGAKPTSIAANKTGMFSITCYGLGEGDVMVAYGVSD
jgi:hypothetical protein